MDTKTLDITLLQAIENLNRLDDITQGELKALRLISSKTTTNVTLKEYEYVIKLYEEYFGPKYRGSMPR